MNLPATKIENVRRKILDTFGDERLGDGRGIFEGDAIDSYATTEEQSAARQRDRDSFGHSSVRETKLDLFDDLWAKVSFGIYNLDDEGSRFFLPLLMLWALTIPGPDECTANQVLWEVAAQSKKGLFTRTELPAIGAWLRLEALAESIDYPDASLGYAACREAYEEWKAEFPEYVDED